MGKLANLVKDYVAAHNFAHRSPPLAHALVLAYQVEWRFAQKDPAAILHRPAHRHLPPALGGGRVVRRTDDIGKLEKRVVEAEPAVPDRLDPPGVDAGSEGRFGLQVPVERRLV